MDTTSNTLITSRHYVYAGGDIMRTNLRAARLEKGLSVADIAERINVSPDIYYKWEAGKRDPLIDNARRVSLILGRSIEELFFADELDKMSNTGTEG